MSISIKVTNDNTSKILKDLSGATLRAMEMIGLNAEKYAKALCPVGTPESTGKKGYIGGTLRNSITHVVNDGENKSVTVGSNVVYAPFVELGTGPHFQAPPEWEKFAPYIKKGGGHGGYVRPRPYLKPAIQDHLKEYEEIIKSELQ